MTELWRQDPDMRPNSTRTKRIIYDTTTNQYVLVVKYFQLILLRLYNWLTLANETDHCVWTNRTCDTSHIIFFMQKSPGGGNSK